MVSSMLQNEFEKSLQQAKRISRAALADMILQMDSKAYLQEERVQMVYWLIACGQKNASARILKECQCENLSPSLQGKVYAAQLRWYLAWGGVQPEIAQPFPVPRWAQKYNSVGFDFEYPTEILDISLLLDNNNEVLAEVLVSCPACRELLTTTTYSDMLPHANPTQSHWICPHCLALRVYNPAKIRESVFRLYDIFFNDLSRDVDGYLSVFDAGLALAYAIALRPLGWIRFLRLYSNKVGHYIVNTAVYRASRLMQGGKPTLDYIGLEPDRAVANSALTELWDRLLPLSPAAGQISSLVGDFEHCGMLLRVIDKENALERYPVVFPFTCRENERALQFLENMGVPRGSKYVCWYCRTQDFVKQHYPDVCESELQLFRNAELSVFRKAIDFLISKGYYVIRMGTPLNPDIPWQSDNLIDYAKKYRTEFMDIWLFAHADLTVGTCSGVDAIPMVSGREVLYVSFSQYGYVLSYTSKTTILFEHYHCNRTKDRLKLFDMFANGYVTDQIDTEFEKHGYYFVKSTEDEILEAVQEKIFLMEGGQRSADDIQLEQAFWSLYERNRDIIIDKYSPPPFWGEQLHGPKYLAHVSSVFLRQYREELLSLQALGL